MDKSLLLELLSEEIPWKMQMDAQTAYQEIFSHGLKELGIQFNTVSVYSGPRRIVIHIDGLPTVMESQVLEIKGPNVEVNQEAIIGFCKKHNISKTQLIIKNLNGQNFYFYSHKTENKKISEILINLIPSLLAKYTFAKSMRWGSYSMRWIRPLRNVLCIFDGTTLPIKFGHLEANNYTFGHRFMSNNQIAVEGWQDYITKLRSHYVIVDHNLRVEIIKNAIKTHSEALNVNVINDELLIQEVSRLVEWPNVLVGNIELKFLNLPKEMIIAAMKNHQKYFCAINHNADIAPYFFFVSNLDLASSQSIIPNPRLNQTNRFESEGAGAYMKYVRKAESRKIRLDHLKMGLGIIHGNERVLCARLEDALFFYTRDLSNSLDSLIPNLSKIVFHAKLGSMELKVHRIKKICKYLNPKDQISQKAAEICKSDILSEVVSEFPELQGIMGYYYALNDGLQTDIAEAIRDHYKPSSLHDTTPRNSGAILALADKIDSLVGLILAGETATSSKDPYALRRNAIGIIRIIIDNNLSISLVELINFVIHVYTEDTSTVAIKISDNVALGTITSFFAERLRFYLKNSYDIKIIDAILNFERNSDINQLLVEIHKIQTLRTHSKGHEIIQAYKRIINICASNEFTSNKLIVEEKLLTLQAELDLYNAFHDMQKYLLTSIHQNNLDHTLTLLADMSKLINDFFNKVLIKSDNMDVMNTRIAVLQQYITLFNQVLDFDLAMKVM